MSSDSQSFLHANLLEADLLTDCRQIICIKLNANKMALDNGASFVNCHLRICQTDLPTITHLSPVPTTTFTAPPSPHHRPNLDEKSTRFSVLDTDSPGETHFHSIRLRDEEKRLISRFQFIFRSFLSKQNLYPIDTG